MSVVAERLFTPGQDMTPYQVPVASVSPVVKLTTKTHAGRVENGTGFFIGDPGFGYTIFTARHVVRPFGNNPQEILILTSGGDSFLARSVAWVHGSSDSTDFAVLMISNDNLRTNALLSGTPSHGSFSAVARGVRAASDVEQVPTALTVQRVAGLLDFTAGSIRPGVSGGPLVAGQRFVGSSIRTNRGLALFEAADLNACISAARTAAV